jgi:hypothetical protein
MLVGHRRHVRVDLGRVGLSGEDQPFIVLRALGSSRSSLTELRTSCERRASRLEPFSSPQCAPVLVPSLPSAPLRFLPLTCQTTGVRADCTRLTTPELEGGRVAFIVECSICGQPWEVPDPIFTVPPRQYIVIPDHDMLGMTDSTPTGIPCPGHQMPGFGIAERSEWENRWSLRRLGRPLPSVLDGSTSVKVVTL